MDKRKKTAAAMGRAVLAAGTALYLCSCAVPQIGNGLWGGAPDPSPERVDTGFEPAGPDSYDSADTAVVVGREEHADFSEPGTGAQVYPVRGRHHRIL